MRMWRVSVIAVIVATSACGEEPDDPQAVVAYTDIDAAFKAATCEYLVRCGQFADTETCLSANLGMNINPIMLSDQIIASIEAGRVRYNGNNAKKCIDALAARTCDITDESGRAPIAECLRVISGVVATGGECWAEVECVSGSCDGNRDTPCTAGKCKDDPPPPQGPKQAGDACSFMGECASGLYCDPNSLKCTALKPAGAACSNAYECEYGFGCAGQSMRTCVVLPTEGEPCPDYMCREDGMYCSATDETGICARVGLAGAMCTSNTQCSSYYQCDFNTSMCVETPRIGQACTLGGPCFDADAYCDVSTLVCMAGRADGEACMYKFQCISQSCSASVCGDVSQSCP